MVVSRDARVMFQPIWRSAKRVIALYRLFLPQCLTAEQIPFNRQRFIGRPWLMMDKRRLVYYVSHLFMAQIKRWKWDGANDEEHPKRKISTATPAGAPARSEHRSPEIHGPLSPVPTLFFVDFSRYFHVSLSYTSGPSARIRGTKHFVRLLSWLHPIHEAVRLSKPLVDSELRRTLHHRGHLHVRVVDAH